MSGTPQSAGFRVQPDATNALRTGNAVSVLRRQGPGELRQVDITFNVASIEIWVNIDSQDLPKASPERVNKRGHRRPRVGGWYVEEFAELEKIFTISYTPATPLVFQDFMEVKIRNVDKVADAKITDSFILFYIHNPAPPLREDGAPQPEIDEDDI